MELLHIVCVIESARVSSKDMLVVCLSALLQKRNGDSDIPNLSAARSRYRDARGLVVHRRSNDIRHE
jgi:hypothetical protein